MTVDLVTPTSDGFVALLEAAIGEQDALVTATMPVLEAGDTSERLFVIIGDIDFQRAGGKGDQLELMSVDIHLVYRGRQRWKLHTMMHRVTDALDGATPAAAGVEFGSIDCIGGASGSTARDGVTHAGILNFEVQAEPA